MKNEDKNSVKNEWREDFVGSFNPWFAREKPIPPCWQALLNIASLPRDGLQSHATRGGITHCNWPWSFIIFQNMQLQPCKKVPGSWANGEINFWHYHLRKKTFWIIWFCLNWTRNMTCGEGYCGLEGRTEEMAKAEPGSKKAPRPQYLH